MRRRLKPEKSSLAWSSNSTRTVRSLAVRACFDFLKIHSAGLRPVLMASFSRAASTRPAAGLPLLNLRSYFCAGG
ncbi:hypothetical protein [Nonomuraea salmonea]|uniref:hypothetical protein n=1 Tax=Nonomuraea salmonea TaxID=46181 RepID=UPI0031EBA04E